MAGKLVGTLGSVVSGVLAVWEGFENRKISPLYGRTMMAMGVGMVLVGLLLYFSVITGGMAFIAALVLSLIMFVVGFIKKDEIERWLDKAIGFGGHRDGVFATIKLQEEALNALGQAEAVVR